MKVTINGFLIYQNEDWLSENERITFRKFKPGLTDKYDVLIAPHTIEASIPDDFDPRPLQIAALETQKGELRAKFAARIKALDDRIQSLLAIECSEVTQ